MHAHLSPSGPRRVNETVLGVAGLFLASPPGVKSPVAGALKQDVPPADAPTQRGFQQARRRGPARPKTGRRGRRAAVSFGSVGGYKHVWAARADGASREGATARTGPITDRVRVREDALPVHRLYSEGPLQCCAGISVRRACPFERQPSRPSQVYPAVW